jgi:hypothetical protein
MAEENRFGEIISKCWGDDAFKKRFLTEPKKVLAEYGMDVPDALNVRVVENTDDTMHLTLPARPPKPTGAGELSDNQLDAVSGGAGTAIKVSPTIIRKLNTMNIATTAAQSTCSKGKECIPW